MLERPGQEHFHSVFYEALLLTLVQAEFLTLCVGKVLAFDINQGKLHLLEKAAKKLGVENVVQTCLCDLREVPVIQVLLHNAILLYFIQIHMTYFYH